MLKYMGSGHVVFKLVSGQVTTEILGDGNLNLFLTVYTEAIEESLFLKLVSVFK